MAEMRRHVQLSAGVTAEARPRRAGDTDSGIARTPNACARKTTPSTMYTSLVGAGSHCTIEARDHRPPLAVPSMGPTAFRDRSLF